MDVGGSIYADKNNSNVSSPVFPNEDTDEMHVMRNFC